MIEHKISIKNDGWIPLISKYDGWCIECKNKIFEGSKILWKKDFGAKHESCPLRSITKVSKLYTQQDQVDYDNIEVIREKLPSDDFEKKKQEREFEKFDD